MILLWGIKEDPPLAKVHRLLELREADVTFLDHRLVGSTTAELRYDGTLNGTITCGDTCIPLEQVTAAYLRPYDFRQYPELEPAAREPGDALTCTILRTEDIIWSWAELADALVLNRPEAMLSNCSKPYQTAIIGELGLAIPDTCLTNSPRGAAAFHRRQGEVIYKSVSGVRSIVSRLDAEKLDRLPSVRWCITQFQRYVEGDNVRVHVVGDRVFGTRIDSDADDYRYAPARLSACMLPEEISQACRTMSRRLQLPLCGIDFKLTPGGEWYCFEVNPSPAYSYYEDGAGQPISDAIADLLLAADRERFPLTVHYNARSA